MNRPWGLEEILTLRSFFYIFWMNSEIVKSLDLRHFESCILHIKCKFYEEVPNLIGYEKPIIYLGGEYIGYRVKDNEKLAPDDNELCPMIEML